MGQKEHTMSNAIVTPEIATQAKEIVAANPFSQEYLEKLQRWESVKLVGINKYRELANALDHDRVAKASRLLQAFTIANSLFDNEHFIVHHARELAKSQSVFQPLVMAISYNYSRVLAREYLENTKAQVLDLELTKSE